MSVELVHGPDGTLWVIDGDPGAYTARPVGPPDTGAVASDLLDAVNTLVDVITGLRKSAQRPNVTKLAYSIDETCTALGITKPTLYKLIASGKLRTVKMEGSKHGRRLVPVAEIHRFLTDEMQ